ncbi:MAG TPA: TetR/AcrR family transcriptional regulator C-terminal domain-containing protein [Kofleriaceae bacterium]|nr:TetR/AcrR family transcriptional regulator C-terminal domain-containing protein [Kofleriaceae bacterium]
MRRQPLTRDAILDAALALLDRHGLASLSMRRLGAALGVEAMSLYNHIPSKDALLDGLHERVLLSLEPPPAQARHWQAFARHQAHALHRALLAHPNAIPLFATRPAATPGSIARLDRYLAVLLQAGFKPLDALSVVQLVAQLVVGHAMWTTSIEMAVTDEPAPPHVAQVERVLDRWDPDRELELGIDALLHGFERLLA